MPRFYFNIRGHDGLDEDEHGTDLPSLERAHDEALKAAREMMAEKVSRGELVDGDRFEITDEEGEVLGVVPLRSVVRFE